MTTPCAMGSRTNISLQHPANAPTHACSDLLMRRYVTKDTVLSAKSWSRAAQAVVQSVNCEYHITWSDLIPQPLDKAHLSRVSWNTASAHTLRSLGGQEILAKEFRTRWLICMGRSTEAITKYNHTWNITSGCLQIRRISGETHDFYVFDKSTISRCSDTRSSPNPAWHMESDHVTMVSAANGRRAPLNRQLGPPTNYPTMHDVIIA